MARVGEDSVAAIQAANAIAAWPDGSPPRSGVPRPVSAFVAITTIDRQHERDQRQLRRRVREPVEQLASCGRATWPEKTR